jgi:hypothetical protein
MGWSGKAVENADDVDVSDSEIQGTRYVVTDLEKLDSPGRLALRVDPSARSSNQQLASRATSGHSERKSAPR